MLTHLRSATINFPYLQASCLTFLTPKSFVVIKTNWLSSVLNQAVKQSDLAFFVGHHILILLCRTIYEDFYSSFSYLENLQNILKQIQSHWWSAHWSGSRFLAEEVCFQEWGSRDILPWKILRFQVHGNAIYTILRQSQRVLISHFLK